MVEKPLVSVVIATYNMAKYLPLAIQSVLAQTYENFELLIVDDGSMDDTSQVVEPFLSDPRVKYFVRKNGGQAAAKNDGVRASHGDYVAFLDADDMWATEKLNMQMPLFSRCGTVGVVYSRYCRIDENGKELGILEGTLYRGRISGRLLVSNFIGFGTSVVKKECFDRMGYFKEDLRMGIDYDLWLRFSTEYEFDYVDHPLLYYREWLGQMSNNCTGRYLNGIAIMQNFLRNFPQVVDQETENEAWAHTYVGFGQCLLRGDGGIGSALNLYIRALRYKPNYLPAWKCMVKAILGMR